ncbi:MAG: AI-2E family transporter [Rhodospirillales bacterium]|jgi:predicted PurR-regulated permease PerM|nr:AI-2E family transporter [Rhodospirillales bacterium]
MTAERRFWVWTGLLIGLCLVLYGLRAVLLPFLAGMGIAYLLDPLADRLERAGLPRSLAAALIILAFFVLLGVSLLIVVPALQAQIIALVSALPDRVAALTETLSPLAKHLKAQLSAEQFERLRTAAVGHVGNVVNTLATFLFNIVSRGIALVAFLSLVLITPVVAFYLLRDWDRIVAGIDGLLPPRTAPVIRAQVREIDARLSGFVRGQALVCLALGSFYAIALTVVGLNYGLLIGLGAGFISFIPYFGTIVGFALSFGVAVGQYGSDWSSIGVVVAVFAAGQVLESYVLTPLLVGDRVGLHPVWIMFALLAGGSLLGFTGLLIAVPAAAVIGVFVRFAIERYRTSGLYAHAPPAADAEGGESTGIDG